MYRRPYLQLSIIGLTIHIGKHYVNWSAILSARYHVNSHQCEDKCAGSRYIWLGLVITTHSILCQHYIDVIITTVASQITSLTVDYSIVYSDADQRKHQSSASLAFVRGIHRGPVNSPHKGPVTREMVPFDDVIMNLGMPHIPVCGTRVLICVRAVMDRFNSCHAET